MKTKFKMAIKQMKRDIIMTSVKISIKQTKCVINTTVKTKPAKSSVKPKEFVIQTSVKM